MADKETETPIDLVLMEGNYADTAEDKRSFMFELEPIARSEAICFYCNEAVTTLPAIMRGGSVYSPYALADDDPEDAAGSGNLVDDVRMYMHTQCAEEFAKDLLLAVHGTRKRFGGTKYRVDGGKNGRKVHLLGIGDAPQIQRRVGPSETK